jgi:hypothetical protein
MNVGIKDGKIAAVTKDELSGKEIINVKGLVVSPGFIDTHQHSLDIADGRLAAQDGTTTHMELEFGRSPVAEAYDHRGKARPPNQLRLCRQLAHAAGRGHDGLRGRGDLRRLGRRLSQGGARRSQIPSRKSRSWR